jgi:hypothetical protein
VAVAPAVVVVVLDERDGRVVAREPSELHADATSAVTTSAGPIRRRRRIGSRYRAGSGRVVHLDSAS